MSAPVKILTPCLKMTGDTTSSSLLVLYSHIQQHNTYTNISGNIVNNNDETSMNERTHFFIKNIPLTLYSRKGDVSCVWEVSWRRGQTATYSPKVLLTIAALLSHSGWVAQPWVTEGPKSCVCRCLSMRQLVPNWLQLQLELELTQADCGIWLYFCLTSTCFLWTYASGTITEFNHVHRSRWYSDIFDRMHLFRCSSAYLHRCISWLTARSRDNM